MNSSADRQSEPEGGTVECLAARDGCQHFLRIWRSETPKAFIVYLHGIEGHGLWFKDTARFLRSKGITTFALDRRGSGLSKEPRGDMSNWQVLYDDLVEVLKHVNAQAEGKPVILMANCWGAKLAAIFAEAQNPDSQLISSLILSSPAICVKVDLPLVEKLKLVWRLITSSKETLPIPLQLKDFTNNGDYIRFIENDTLRLTDATANFYLNTFILTLLSKNSAKNISLPTLVVQSGIDSIVDAAGGKKWFEKLPSTDKKYVDFPGTWHSLDFDKTPEKYRQTLLNWVESHAETLVL